MVDEKKQEDWMQKKWRPAMGWTYMIICLLDMAVFPVIWSLAQVITKQPISQWTYATTIFIKYSFIILNLSFL
jgi:hypothetical protein